MKIIAKYIHGSEDSIDIDVYYVIDKITTFNEAKKCCDSYKDENVNIIEIDNGEVVNCYKGSCDEIQNSLLRTYPLHKQEFDLLIKEPVTRDILIKVVRVVRCFLSHLSRTQYRKEVKLALQTPNWKLKLDTLKSIDFNLISDYKENKEDVLKVFAFQLAQVLGLLNQPYKEIYTKSEASENFPTLKKYLYREPTELYHLLIQFYKFISYCDSIDDMGLYIDLKTEKRIK